MLSLRKTAITAHGAVDKPTIGIRPIASEAQGQGQLFRRHSLPHEGQQRRDEARLQEIAGGHVSSRRRSAESSEESAVLCVAEG